MALPKGRAQWKEALNALPSTPEKIPSFFFGHGSPMLAVPNGRGAMGPSGPLGLFLKDFGPVLLKKYNPKAILVISAHWETYGERLGTSLSCCVFSE